MDLVYDKCSFVMTWTVSKFDGIISIFSEEFLKFAGNRWYVSLIGVWWWIEDSFSSMDGICDDNNSIDIVQIGGLINITSNGEELSLSCCDINSMMDYLDNWTVIDMDICYWGSNLVFDTCIWYNDYGF